MFASPISITKLIGKQTHVNWDYFHDKPLYFICFNNQTVNLKSVKEVTPKKQNKCRKFLHIAERKRFTNCTWGRPQELEKTLFPQNHAEPLAKLAKILCPHSLTLFVVGKLHKRITFISYILRSPPKKP